MGAIGSLYDLSRSAMEADQQALAVTSNNVANQNTAGYTREVVSWQDGDTVTLNGSMAPTVTTSSVRDRVLDQRVQQATQDASSDSARSGVLSQLEEVYSLSGSSTSSGSTALGTALNSFYSSLSTLSSTPTNSAAQSAALGAAQTLASAFNSASTQLTGIGSGISSTLTSSVSSVNSLTTTIAGLNTDIAEQSPNSDAGTLEDQRQNAITQLSQLIGLDQITTESNGINLTTSNGLVLVSGGTSSQLSAVTTGTGTQIRDSSGQDVSGSLTGGSIGGLLAGQNVDLANASSELDALAYRVATTVNAQNQAGYTSSGTAGTALFNVTSTATGAAAALSVIPTSGAAIATAGTGEGATGTTNILALAALATATDSSGTTTSGQLGTMLSNIGTQAATTSAQSTNSSALVTQLTTQNDSESAVSLDDEAANLTTYQRSYDAAAKLFSIADSIMVTALNLGEQTAVS